MTQGTRSHISRQMRCLLVWLSACGVAGAQQLSQQPRIGLGSYPAIVSAKLAPATAAPGDTVKVQVTATLDDGFHTYDIVQPDMKDVATQLTVELPDSLQVVGDWTGTAADERTENEKTIFVHYTSPTWELELKVAGDTAAGDYKIAGKIRLIVCSDFGCLPPKTERFELALNVLGAPNGNAAAASTSNPATAELKPELIAADSPSNQSTASADDTGGGALPTFTPKHVDFVIENVWIALGAGLLAGLILNVMPCVLPVISLKIYGYVKQAGQDRRRIQAMGLSFCAGILFVFLIFGALFAYAGQTWGALFQSDTFNVVMVAVLVGCALWMFEVFILTVPGVISDADAAASARKDLIGEFFKGTLATLLSTPCSGPLLIPVISFALKTQNPPIIFATLTAVGLGMSVPYLLLAWKPGWMKVMPKPGDWMRTFKELMGFLLLGTAIWLLWQRRRNGELVVWTVAFSTFVALAGWLYGRWSDPMKSNAKRLAAPLLAILLIALGAYFSFGIMYQSPSSISSRATNAPSALGASGSSGESDAQQMNSSARSGEILTEADYHWQPFDLKAFLAAQSKGKTIVVDWTADW
jgi:suppressor for copper-sensitivity B